jgi:hypothetical protein
MKAANRKTSRRGAKRVRTPEELEIKRTLAAIQEYLRENPLVERKKKLRKPIERSECSEILFGNTSTERQTAFRGGRGTKPRRHGREAQDERVRGIRLVEDQESEIHPGSWAA